MGVAIAWGVIETKGDAGKEGIRVGKEILGLGIKSVLKITHGTK